MGRCRHPPGTADTLPAFSCPASPASSTSPPTQGDHVLVYSSEPVHADLAGCPSPGPTQGELGKAAGTHGGHPVLALVGDKVGVEAPAQGGLLDVVR